MSKWMERPVRAVKGLLRRLKRLLALLKPGPLKLENSQRKLALVDIKGDSTVFVYSDDLKFLTKNGECHTARAGYVEPYVQHGQLMWYVDLTPLKGEFVSGFYSQAAALQFERKWVMDNIDKARDVEN